MDKNLYLLLHLELRTLTAIVAKGYIAVFINCIQPVIEKILWKNQNGFRRNRLTTSLILTISRIIEVMRTKNIVETLLFINLFKVFDSLQRGMIEQYYKQMVFRKKMLQLQWCLIKKKKQGSNSSLSWWNLGLLWHSHWSFARRYMSVICVYNLPRLHTSNVIRSYKRKWLYTKKERSEWYSPKTITKADYADDLAGLAKTPAKAESLL